MDPRTGQGEVVPHGIVRPEPTKGLGDLQGGPKVVGLPGKEAEAATGRPHVGVQGNDQTGGTHPGPAAGIHGVLPDHPSQIEEEALAGGTPARAGKEVVPPRGLPGRARPPVSRQILQGGGKAVRPP